jgi:hypothetical protein
MRQVWGLEFEVWSYPKPQTICVRFRTLPVRLRTMAFAANLKSLMDKGFTRMAQALPDR